MSASTYEELAGHIGHEVEVVGYGLTGEPPRNVSAECVTCGSVITDYDHPDYAEPSPFASAVEELGEVLGNEYGAGDFGPAFTCEEVDRVALALTRLGQGKAAARLLLAHAVHPDEDEGDRHHGWDNLRVVRWINEEVHA